MSSVSELKDDLKNESPTVTPNTSHDSLESLDYETKSSPTIPTSWSSLLDYKPTSKRPFLFRSFSFG